MPKNTDTSVIPRPLNCFLIYRLEKQQEIVAKCSGANHRDISKIIAKWWKEASEEEKRPFREKARLAKLEHSKLYPDYKYAPRKKNTPRRVYIRRNKKEPFTSRHQENNKLMEMIYEDSNVLQSLEPIPNDPKPKRSAYKPKANKQYKESTTLYNANKIVRSDINQLDDYFGYQVNTPFPAVSFLSPFSESYSDYDAPSPFSASVNSFDMNQNFMPSPSPGASLDFSCINGINSSTSYFDNIASLNMTNSYVMTDYDMLYSAGVSEGYDYYGSQCDDYFMSQKQQYIDPRLLNTA